MLTAAGAIAHPESYTPKTWHVYLIMLALLLTQGLITMQSTKFIGWVNKVKQGIYRASAVLTIPRSVLS